MPTINPQVVILSKEHQIFSISHALLLNHRIRAVFNFFNTSVDKKAFTRRQKKTFLISYNNTIRKNHIKNGIGSAVVYFSKENFRQPLSTSLVYVDGTQYNLLHIDYNAQLVGTSINASNRGSNPRVNHKIYYIKHKTFNHSQQPTRTGV